jgi:DNA-binding GntR family transcriptional regulator
VGSGNRPAGDAWLRTQTWCRNSQLDRQRMTTDLANGGGFLYRAVMDALGARIAEGLYLPGERIPGVEALAGEFNVSTITVRRAIRELSLGGVLIGRQGRGVFVTSARRIVRSVRIDQVSPIEQELRANGIEPGLRELGMTLVPVTDEPFLAGLQGAERHVHRIERVLLADGEAVGLDTLWLPRWLAARLRGKLHGRFILSQLADHNIVPHSFTYQAEATIATDTQAALLSVAFGSPLLVVRYFPIGTSGRPLMAGRTITRADRFTYEFSGHGTAAQSGAVPRSVAAGRSIGRSAPGRSRIRTTAR